MDTPQVNMPHTLRLGPTLDIYGSEQIQRTLLEHLSASREVVLDLGAVEGCDAAGVQLLCSACRTATETGKPFRLEQIPQVVTDCCARLGLSPEVLTGSAS